jgi:hypothetical protein
METPKLYNREQKPTSITLTPDQKSAINNITRNIDTVADDVLDQVIENNDVVKTLENGHVLNRLINNQEGATIGYIACEDFVPTEAYIKYLGTDGSSGRNLLSELPAFFEYAKEKGYTKLNFHGWNERLNNILKRYGFERLRTDSLGEFSADFYEKTLQEQKTPEQVNQERIKAFEEKFITKVQQEYQKTLQTFKEHQETVTQKINQTTETVANRIDDLTDKNKLVLKLKLARHYQNNETIDINVLVDALLETPKFLESDKGSIHRIFEIHEQKTLQKIADQRYIRSFQTKFSNIANDNETQQDHIVTDVVNKFNLQTIRESFVVLDEFYNNPSFTNEQKNATFRTIEETYHVDVFSKFNPYEALFTTSSGDYYMARLLNMPHLKAESAYMNHCVGTSDSFVSKINRGEIEILSFRKTPTINKEENKLNIDDTPLITIEYNLKTKTIQQMKKYSDKYLQTSDPYYNDVLDALSQIRNTTTDTGEKRDFKSINASELQNISVPDYHIFTNKGEVSITDYNPNDPDVFVLKKGNMDITQAGLSEQDVEKIIQIEIGQNIKYFEIGFGVENITSETKLYIGPWSPDIMHQIPETVEHLYEKFPEQQILRRKLELTPKTPEQYETELTQNGNQISGYAKDILYKMQPLENNETIDIVSFTVAQLGFESSVTYAEIKQRALQLGLQLCPPQVGPQLRLDFTDQPQNTYYRIAMEAIPDRRGDPALFGVDRGEGGDWLDRGDGREAGQFVPDCQFVFCSSKSLSPVNSGTE